MNPLFPFRKIRRAAARRGLTSKFGSLLLLFQRSPLVQMLFPEARVLGGAGLGQVTKWTVTAIAGLGAYDTVAGATEIAQVSPDLGAGEVPAVTGEFLTFIVQVAGTPSTNQVSWSVDGLPPGLSHDDLSEPSLHRISGIPTEVGETTVTVTAWEAPNQTGSSFSKEFLIIVSPAAIVTAPLVISQPASTTITSGGTANLSVAFSGSKPSIQWYQGSSGVTTDPVSGATSTSFTTPALTATTPYWARATNSAGSADSNTAIVTVNPAGAGPFKIGETVSIDLNPLRNAGESLKLVGKLPKGLKMNLATGLVTGTVTGLTGTYPLKIQMLQGNTLLREVDFPIVIAGSLFFAGNYEALLESNGTMPAGAFKLQFKKGNAWRATLESPGAKRRKASGKLTLAPGSTAGILSATFAPSGSAPAVSLSLTLDLESPMVSGSYNGGTIRGFRLARNEELPVASTLLNLVFEAGTHDGMTVPAGLGWASGAIGPTGTGTFSGLLGDGTTVSLALHLSATGQSILWAQPYANTSSYFGGIVTLPDLGQTPADDPPLAEKTGWFKGPDTKSLSYPAGFPAMEVTVGSSKWTVPANAPALGASLGWLNNDSPVVEIDGAGLSNAAPQPANPTLPTGFTLDAAFNLLAPVSPSVVPWTGKVTAANGTFAGSLALPSAFVADGVAGAAAASGVLLQADEWGTVTGCGLIKVPVAGSKGSFRTAAIILNQ